MIIWISTSLWLRGGSYLISNWSIVLLEIIASSSSIEHPVGPSPMSLISRASNAHFLRNFAKLVDTELQRHNKCYVGKPETFMATVSVYKLISQHVFWLEGSCFACNTFHVRWICSASMEVVWRFEQRTFKLFHWGSDSFWHAIKRRWNEFGPQCTRIGCPSFRFNHYLPACTTSGRKYLCYMQINQWKIIDTDSWRKVPISYGQLYWRPNVLPQREQIVRAKGQEPAKVVASNGQSSNCDLWQG